MKKWFKLMLLMLCAALLLLMNSCSRNPSGAVDGQEDTDEKESETIENSIELTMENFEYYLSIDEVVISSGSAAGGTIRYATYKVTVSGAINGLFQGCSLYYRIGDGNECEVKLNAAGFATFNYVASNQTGQFAFTRATGKIII